MAISLTAPTDNLRDSIVPVNKRFNLQDVQNFIRKVDLHRGDRITIEYALMEGVNDTDEMTGRLLGYLKPITSRIKVNLIPWNTVSGLKFRSPDMARVFAMQEKMKAAGILTFIRKNRGRDSSAACGQLAGRI
jgi:23S rRNA (adenine2503-C2)-methyltransferase